jgi:hypothetical protein
MLNDLGFEFMHVQEVLQTSTGAHQSPVQLVLGVSFLWNIAAKV